MANSDAALSPFVELPRSEWAELAKHTQTPLTEAEIEKIRGLGDFLDLAEVSEIYLPLSQLLNLYVSETQQLHQITGKFLEKTNKRTPFIIGVAGSVAVGKSTVSRLLKELLSRWPSTPKVALVTTDGFLYPNAVLAERGLMARKGFPESYNRLALLKFVADIKSGKEQVTAPLYSHLSYDIVPGEVIVDSPDVVIVEGLNVLQPPALGQEVALSDYFDFKIYVDAETTEIEKWYLERFKELRKSAFRDPASYFHRYAELTEEETLTRAKEIWRDINLPNLLENIISTRSRATLVLKKGEEHRVEKVLLRKI
ncbi:MAG: type I pantothenate kinase [Micrococcales bacterium]|nr:type I pantothenate kinase [Micrococcales bacterium]NBR61516.1 type I pantothenate kinase [Actinomycetota bacterium]NBR55008.1 type I pantothenate kinase [Micrococcales bacterium]NBT47019.1 type I pantothenate kinase [Actinomycetota bacterium]NBY43546.1 type I pantothenate kinase [Micrococcales bacterium]